MKNKFLQLTPIFLFTLMLMACSPVATAAPTESMPTSTVQPQDTPATNIPGVQPVSVVYVKDGDIQVWEESQGQSGTLYSSGDVISVLPSTDSQAIAFIRRSAVKLSELEWREQSELWVIDRDGSNPRQLVTAETLRDYLKTSERESSAFLQLAWIPNSHDLLFSTTKYIVQAEGLSHAFPQGVFHVDTGTAAVTTLLGMDRNLRFSASPDGQQIALMSSSGLSFIQADGGNLRQEVLTYPDVSSSVMVFPSGVWTQDSRAFLITSFLESDSMGEMNFELERVFIDGSGMDILASISVDSHQNSVHYSPDGKLAAYYRWPEVTWNITPLAVEVGPLAIPTTIELGFANLHWSPAGEAFAVNAMDLEHLCPDATLNTEVCGDPVELQGTPAVIEWVDDSTFLYLTSEPGMLYLARLDGTHQQIVAWQTVEYPNAGSFALLK